MPMPLDNVSSQPGHARLTSFQQELDPARIYVKPAEQLADRAGARLRILSWNIGCGHDPHLIADTIGAIAPDVACLQEVDWGCCRTQGRDVLQLLAARTGMLGLYAIEFFELNGPRRPRANAGGGVTGNALLTRVRPQASFRINLPDALDWEHGAADAGLPLRVRRQLRREPRLGRRCAIGMTLDAGQGLSVWSVHCEDKFGGVAGRFAQFRTLVTAAQPGACVIAGDFNTFDSPAARLLRPDGGGRALGKPSLVRETDWWRTALLPPLAFADPFDPSVWTFRAGGLIRLKLDWIVARDCEIGACGAGPMAPSDHRPIWADITVGAKPKSKESPRYLSQSRWW